MIFYRYEKVQPLYFLYEDVAKLEKLIKENNYKDFVTFVNFHHISMGDFSTMLDFIDFTKRENFYLFIIEQLINKKYPAGKDHEKNYILIKEMLQKYKIFKTFYNQELADEILAKLLDENKIIIPILQDKFKLVKISPNYVGEPSL